MVEFSGNLLTFLVFVITVRRTFVFLGNFGALVFTLFHSHNHNSWQAKFLATCWSSVSE